MAMGIKRNTSKEYFGGVFLGFIPKLEQIALLADETIHEILDLKEKDVSAPDRDTWLRYKNPDGRHASALDYHTNVDGLIINLPLFQLNFHSLGFNLRDKEVILAKLDKESSQPKLTGFGFIKENLSEEDQVTIKTLIKSGFEQPVLS
jgi:hypothetical protein